MKEVDLETSVPARIFDYLVQVPYSKLIDLEDPEYKSIQISYALVKWPNTTLVYLLEFDIENTEKLWKYVGTLSRRFEPWTVFVDLKLKKFLRIINLTST